MKPTHRPHSLSIVACGALAATVFPARSHAADAAPAPPPKPAWESSAGLGLTLTRGNSENLLITGMVLTQKKWDSHELRFGADGGYGESTVEVDGTETTSKNTDFVRGFGQYNKLFSDRFYGYVRAEALHDEIADIAYRITLSPGVGYYFLKDKTDTLSAEFGPGYVVEKVGGESDNYAVLRFAERFEHKFSDRARLWQSAEYLPQVDDFANYTLNAEVGVAADLTKKLEVKTYIQDTYRSHAAAGRKQNDIKLVAGLNYKF